MDTAKKSLHTIILEGAKNVLKGTDKKKPETFNGVRFRDCYFIGIKICKTMSKSIDEALLDSRYSSHEQHNSAR